MRRLVITLVRRLKSSLPQGFTNDVMTESHMVYEAEGEAMRQVEASAKVV